MISQHTILELLYKLDSNNMHHIFETFFFSNPAQGHCEHNEGHNLLFYYCDILVFLP